MRNSIEKLDRTEQFAIILELRITDNSMMYSAENDASPMTGWNQPSASFGYTMIHRPECDIAFSLECAYFENEINKILEEKMIELGKCFAKTIKEYIEVNQYEKHQI